MIIFSTEFIILNANNDGSNGSLSAGDVEKLFGNVDSLLALSGQLLGMLRDRIGDEHASDWSSSQVRFDSFFPSFPRHFPFVLTDIRCKTAETGGYFCDSGAVFQGFRGVRGGF